MSFLDFLKAIVFGIVEGVTEWLPVSSTGHMILLQKIMPLKVSDAFLEMFLVVIQLGAIIAIVVLFWNRLWPLRKTKEGVEVRTGVLKLWGRILVSCLPAAVIGILLDDWIDEHFYNYICVSIMLILVGVCFILVENKNKGVRPQVTKISGITYPLSLYIGLFQVIAAVLPGTSRSGATIVGALLLGVSRRVAAEYTFYLAVPVMAGASLLKIVKYIAAGEAALGGVEWLTLFTGMIVAFIVSLFAVKFLLGFTRKHDFRIFGYYRIALGIIVLLIFLIAG